MKKAIEQVKKTFKNMTNAYAKTVWNYLTAREKEADKFRKQKGSYKLSEDCYRVGFQFKYRNPRTGESKDFIDTMDIRGRTTKENLQSDLRDRVRVGLIAVADKSGVNERNVKGVMGPITITTLEAC